MGMLRGGLEATRQVGPKLEQDCYECTRGLGMGHRLKGKGCGNMKWEGDKAKAPTAFGHPLRMPLLRTCGEGTWWSRLLRQERGRWLCQPRVQVPAMTLNKQEACPPPSKLQWSSLRAIDYEIWTPNNPAWSERGVRGGRRRRGREESRKEKNRKRAYQGPALSAQALVVVSLDKTSISNFKDIDMYGRLDR